ncbi:Uncharacterised protein [Mycobacteroides abscessus subsp. abscessus]|nr:Uncharacterised protein [Mycobacteroides abscessus subsp. abscessus]
MTTTDCPSTVALPVPRARALTSLSAVLLSRFDLSLASTWTLRGLPALASGTRSVTAVGSGRVEATTLMVIETGRSLPWMSRTRPDRTTAEPGVASTLALA